MKVAQILSISGAGAAIKFAVELYFTATVRYLVLINFTVEVTNDICYGSRT